MEPLKDKIGKLVVYSEFGSKIYGTSTPKSDQDYKGVYIPKPEDILLQRVPKTSINHKSKSDQTIKNSAKDTDIELFTLQSFIRLCEEGQTVAIDLLFTPPQFIIDDSEEWEYIQANRQKLIHQGTSAFFGYAQQQAAKYGIKGSRIAALRHVLAILKQLDPTKTLQESLPISEVKTGEHIAWVTCKAPNDRQELHLEVCNRKMPIHARVKYAIETFQRILDEYGKRALAAEKNENIDWKAMSHAVRVAGQAKELLLTGHVTFPRPDASFLLDIKEGKLPYRPIAEILENALEELNECKKISKLPATIPKDKWDAYIVTQYAQLILSAEPSKR